MTITWHSPTEMLPQVGQECWVQLQLDDEPLAYPMTFARSGYGEIAAWKDSDGSLATVDLVRCWTPREGLNRPWGGIYQLTPEEAGS